MTTPLPTRRRVGDRRRRDAGDAGGAARQRHQGVRRRAACWTTSRSTCRPAAGFVILGRSGTGKSVTLRHIVGLVRPDRGKVFVGADEISVLTGAELSRVRRKIGFLFQNAALFDSISRRRERGVPAAPAHQAAGSRRSASAPRQKLARSASSRSTTRCRPRSPAACASAPAWRARMALDPPHPAGRRAERRPRSRSPPTRSTSCCSI